MMNLFWKIKLETQIFVRSVLLYCYRFLFIIQNNNIKKLPKYKQIGYKKCLTIDIDIKQKEIERNYARILRTEQEKINMDTTYFQKYLFHLHGFEKSREEIEIILKKITCIKRIVLENIKSNNLYLINIVKGIINSDNYFYEKKCRDISVKLYRFIYYNKPSILKCYLFLPDFAYYTSIIESRFENEIIFQTYASELNKLYNFITPKIYDFGTCFVKLRENSKINKYKCLFLIMENIDGLTIENIEFNSKTCKDIYKLERDLRCELLSHNDFMPRNIMRKLSINKYNDQYVILDYGEATLCCMPYKH